eukprot:gene13315-15735_t
MVTSEGMQTFVDAPVTSNGYTQLLQIQYAGWLFKTGSYGGIPKPFYAWLQDGWIRFYTSECNGTQPESDFDLSLATSMRWNDLQEFQELGITRSWTIESAKRKCNLFATSADEAAGWFRALADALPGTAAVAQHEGTKTDSRSNRSNRSPESESGASCSSEVTNQTFGGSVATGSIAAHRTSDIDAVLNIVNEGWIMVEEGTKNRYGLPKDLKKRWFVLNSTHLNGYKSESDSQPHLELELLSLTAMRWTQPNGNQRALDSGATAGLELQFVSQDANGHQEENTWLLFLESSEEADEWWQAMNTALQRARNVTGGKGDKAEKAAKAEENSLAGAPLEAASAGAGPSAKRGSVFQAAKRDSVVLGSSAASSGARQSFLNHTRSPSSQTSVGTTSTGFSGGSASSHINANPALYGLNESNVCGWIYKQCRDKKFKKRWFVLANCTLTYYQSSKTGDPAKQNIDLSFVTALRWVTDEKYKINSGDLGVAFEMDTQTRKWVLVFKDKDEATAWWSGLQDAIREIESKLNIKRRSILRVERENSVAHVRLHSTTLKEKANLQTRLYCSVTMQDYNIGGMESSLRRTDWKMGSLTSSEYKWNEQYEFPLAQGSRTELVIRLFKKRVAKSSQEQGVARFAYDKFSTGVQIKLAQENGEAIPEDSAQE